MKIIRLADVLVSGLSHDPLIGKQVLLAKGDIPHLTHFSVVRLLPAQSTSPHSHADLYEGFFCVSGRGNVRINGEDQTLTPGTLCVIEPNETHEITNPTESELVIIYFGIES
jgi:quercetin dioxygenase-like cupin family protein